MNINTNTWNRIRYSIYQPFYDVIAGFFRPLRKQSIEDLQLQTGEKVLILGAGTGLDLEFLSSDLQIYAIDITPAMLSRLKQKADKTGLEVHAEVMDGSNLSFTDNSFDAVILHLILAVMPDPEKCLQETERILKPGGRFTVIDKFLEANTKPGLIRQLANPVANLLATDLNRNFDKIITHTDLLKTSDKKIRKVFRIIQGTKTG